MRGFLWNTPIFLDRFDSQLGVSKSYHSEHDQPVVFRSIVDIPFGQSIPLLPAKTHHRLLAG
jgi:hypothetical protein